MESEMFESLKLKGRRLSSISSWICIRAGQRRPLAADAHEEVEGGSVKMRVGFARSG